MNPVDLYAHAVVDGDLPAGKYHKLACARHLKDRGREGTPAFPYRFELAKAERFWRFAEKLRHYKGEWAGQLIHLELWQQFVTGSLFGWISTETGFRRFRTAFLQVPRKNGKTLLAAIVLLYLTFFDDEPGAGGYSIAMKRDQAKIVFNDAKALVQSSGLKDRIMVRVASLSRDATASKLEPLGNDHDSTDGLNPHVVVVDEMHAMKDRGMLDVMETATGARRQPVIFEITTFGSDALSPWGDQNDYGNKILDGVLTDESFFAFVTHADLDDLWDAPETARKANPNYGKSVKPDDLAAKVRKAKGIPSAAATYKQKHLNLLVNADQPCLSVDGWRKGQNPQRLSREAWLERLAHQPCFAGIDLASKIDLCDLSLVFPPGVDHPLWCVIQHIWTPRDTLADRAHRDRAPYELWVEQGTLVATEGTQIDHQLIRPVLTAAREQYDLQQIGFDPWHADTLITQLTNEDGFPETQVLAVPQTFGGMSSACLKVQAEILGGGIDAFGCPVTAWAVSNVAPSTDGKENLMFSKKKSRGRIDPVIGFTVGVALYLRQPIAAPSVYLDRGIRTLGQ